MRGYGTRQPFGTCPRRALCTHGRVHPLSGHSGRGIVDTLKKGIDSVKNFGTTILNQMPNADATGRPLFPGERHMPLQLKNGRMGIANYAGPGTQVVKRLQRGDPARTPVDKVAERHDVDFTLSANAPTVADQQRQIREADKRMVNKLNQIQRQGLDTNRNVRIARGIIRGKMKLEDLGLLRKDKYSGKLQKLPEASTRILEAARRRLQQDGYGRDDEPPLPGADLKDHVLKSLRKKKKQRAFVVRLNRQVMPGLCRKLRCRKVALASDTNASTPKQLARHMLPLLVRAKGVAPRPAVLKKLKARKLDRKLAQALASVKKGQSGTGFWKHFVKTFRKIVKPGAEAIGAAATVLGAPEFGIPLGLAGTAM